MKIASIALKSLENNDKVTFGLQAAHMTAHLCSMKQRKLNIRRTTDLTLNFPQQCPSADKFNPFKAL